MAITNAQQARQLYNNGGPMRKIKGQDHMLAYITPGERDTLVDLGGQETMTPEGILAYPPEGNYGSEAKGQGSGPGKSGITGMASTGGANFSSGNNVADGGTGKTSNPTTRIGGEDFDVVDTNIKERQEAEERAAAKRQREIDEFVETKRKPVNTPFPVVNTALNFLGNVLPNSRKFYAANQNILSKYGYDLEDYDQYDKDRKAGLINAYGRTLTDAERDNQGGGRGEGDTSQTYIPPIIPDDSTDDTEEEPVPDRNLGGLAARFGGSKFNFDNLADGGRAGFKDGEGIMQTASAPDPMDERNSMMETIAMEEFGKPLSDLNEDEIIQIELFMEEMSKRKNEPRFMAQQSGITRAGAMDGGRMMMMANQEEDDPTGGIMDLESGRQMYFLGKLVKKATRAVKKIVKSPVGKAALMYFGGNALMGAGGGKGLSSFFGKGSFNPLKALITTTGQDGAASGLGLSKLGQIFNKFGLATGEGAMTLGGKLGLGFGIPMALDALGVGKEDDKMDLDEYYRKNGINIADIRNNPYNFLAPRFAADGGLMRTGYAEGSKEPVAKETMPLIDMDGKEMDLREDGGFVPLGRMERADDVPARLSKNEFVFTADAVRNAGEGDIDKGAEVMYNMMKNLESGGDVSEESQGLDGAREMFQTSQRLEEVL